MDECTAFLKLSSFSDLAMASVAHLPSYTVEDVIKTADTTFNEYQHASQKFASDANALMLLPVLSLQLVHVQSLLESIVDDEEVLERLESIIVGEPTKRHSFLSGLNVDLQAICTYLQNVNPSGGSLKKADLDIYSQALKRYGEVLKIVRKRNAQYVFACSYSS
jgi:hypothetical protein